MTQRQIKFTGYPDCDGNIIHVGDTIGYDYSGDGECLEYIVEYIDGIQGYSPFDSQKWAERGSNKWKILKCPHLLNPAE